MNWNKLKTNDTNQCSNTWMVYCIILLYAFILEHLSNIFPSPASAEITNISRNCWTESYQTCRQSYCSILHKESPYWNSTHPSTHLFFPLILLLCFPHPNYISHVPLATSPTERQFWFHFLWGRFFDPSATFILGRRLKMKMTTEGKCYVYTKCWTVYHFCQT